MKISLFCLVIGLWILHTSSVIGQNTRIVDVDKALHQSTEYKMMDSIYLLTKDSFNQLLEERVSLFKKKLTWVQDADIADERKKTIQRELFRQEKSLTAAYSFLQDTMPQLKMKRIDVIYRKINRVIKEYCEKNKISILLNRTNTNYFDPALDITDSIIAAYQVHSRTDGDNLADWKITLERSFIKYNKYLIN